MYYGGAVCNRPKAQGDCKSPLHAQTVHLTRLFFRLHNDMDYICDMKELKYIISGECPGDLQQDATIEEWKRFLDDCHVDYSIQYIVANDLLKERIADPFHKQSVKDCPEIDLVCPQIDTTIRIKRITDEELKKIVLK